VSNWLHGVDISHYQSDVRLPWLEIAKTSHFVIIKASDGTSKDPGCKGHVEHARDAGLAVGLYHFFRDPLPVGNQFRMFGEVADACSLAPGDLLPALDVEDYPGHTIGPPTSELAEQWCNAAKNIWGGAMLYCSQRDWARMGASQGLLQFALWVAHYPGRELPGPATPDHKPWRIWQYAVHPYAPGVWTNDFKSPLAIDHNWAIDPLPVIAQAGQVAPEPDPVQVVPTYLTDVDWAEFNAARSRDVEAEDDPTPTPRTV
jgi:GH25 family lysozyme M1 (1,4-beta-N-acetylmuramidase)